MVKLRELLGAAGEVHFECMYTKHKSQKRKTWHDGFLSLYASRRLVLCEDAPATGKVLDEAKVGPPDWDRKDDEFIETAKFLIDVIDTTPLTVNSHSTSAAAVVETAPFDDGASSSSSSALSGLGRRTNTAPNNKFRTPVAHGPPRLTKATASRDRFNTGGSNRAGAAAEADKFDFARFPTSEWEYTPDAIVRSPAEVLALLNR